MATTEIEDRESSFEPPLRADRPTIGSGVPDRIRSWVEWFGVVRLVTSAAAMVIVCVGAFWLIRTPPPPTEAALPMASARPEPTGSATSTLPPPLTTPAADGNSGDGLADGSGSGAASELEPLGAVVFVHVAGAVERPGVYELASGSRVDAAVARAGGASADADADALNLASVLVDGARIYVPTIGEDVDPSTLISGGATSTGRAAASGEAVPSGPIDLNQAPSAALETLPGIGPATALAIITERDSNGPFAGVADLERVPGIGPIKVAALDGLVTT